jgi:hypothetical protein
MVAAHEFMRDELQVDLGLLVCGRALVPYYEHLGWRLVKDRLLYDQPAGKQLFHDKVMILPIHAGQIPEGDIDIQGPPW